MRRAGADRDAAHRHARGLPRARWRARWCGCSGVRFRDPAARRACRRAAGGALVAVGASLRLARWDSRCAAAPAGSPKIPGAARVRCCGATACAWDWRARWPDTDRRLSPPPSRTTNPPHWRARIPISRTNRRTTFFSTRWCGRASPGLLLLAAWCALGFAAAWKIRGKHPDAGARAWRPRWPPESSASSSRCSPFRRR